MNVCSPFRFSDVMKLLHRLFTQSKYRLMNESEAELTLTVTFSAAFPTQTLLNRTSRRPNILPARRPKLTVARSLVKITEQSASPRSLHLQLMTGLVLMAAEASPAKE